MYNLENLVLNEHEKFVLREALRGIPLAESAQTISTSPGMIRKYRYSAFNKLGAEDICAAVVVAIKRGIITKHEFKQAVELRRGKWRFAVPERRPCERTR